MLTLSDFKTLRGCFLFENFGNNELFKLNDFLREENCSVIQYQKDEYIFNDESFYKFGVFLSGKATAVCWEENKGVLRSFSQGDVFGAAGVFCKDAGLALPKIKTDSICRILFLSRKCLEKIIKNNPETAIKYIEFLSNRVWFLNNRIATFTSSQAVSRLAKFILENEVLIQERDVNFAELARKLDISRASFYRAKNELEESGAALLDSKKITILNKEILRSYYE